MKMTKKMKDKNSSSEDKNYLNDAVLAFFKRNIANIILLLCAFAALSVINYFNISTTETVASFTLNDFEIGQIADRTIIAAKSLSPDIENPVAVEEGEKIIRKGFPISAEAYEKLRKIAESPIYMDFRAFANYTLYLLLIAILWCFLCSSEILGIRVNFKESLVEVIFFVLVFAIASLGRKSPLFASDYSILIIIPCAFAIFLITVLFNHISTYFFVCMLSLGVLCATGFRLIPALYTLCSSISAAIIVRRITRRIDMVLASILISVLNAVFVILLKVIFNDNFSDGVQIFAGVALSGFISGILALGFLTPLEMLLNTASVFRLMDLSDVNNQPIMRRMLLVASGTYSHSMMVSSLAENAAHAIGANALLARVGAYYHDIGKLDQPEYFTENQGSMENKHNEINPSLSVSIIRSHVKKGVEKARQMHLPQPIIDIIAEHHGNSVIAYFYNEAKKKDPNVSPEDFSYNGTPPSTRESAVVMLADTVEAACRTLENPSASRIDKFVKQLIAAKIEHHQLDNCPITFSDIAKIRESFVQLLTAYHHTRVEYPDQKDPDEAETAPSNDEIPAEKDQDETKKNG
ncbi:HDIG domain-containing protein [Treponema parvum]|uniref:HDIG domain-containing protein n=1 Tax=Treponema parvum TaxID=138851 RepID=A0A975IEY0_9SPIR|nr:HDIG domain-containing metalloprotein [Treponema parvum]QTQ13754.1 HDIG domain-containing protein [Treponema parvum]